ncbi:hypothetical protein [Azorhizophilus paspali]|uniref:Uncharacterized protein n=1 Tax=Azorhizophilus paspali TaxID=69963 RepID=A0ABV6SKU7_AZOPA
MLLESCGEFAAAYMFMACRGSVVVRCRIGRAGIVRRNGAHSEILEPMVFDMMRPLGARQGELEADVLATGPLSESDQRTDWTPEAEYAFAEG